MGIRADAGYQIGFRLDSPSCDTSTPKNISKDQTALQPVSLLDLHAPPHSSRLCDSRLPDISLLLYVILNTRILPDFVHRSFGRASNKLSTLSGRCASTACHSGICEAQAMHGVACITGQSTFFSFSTL